MGFDKKKLLIQNKKLKKKKAKTEKKLFKTTLSPSQPSLFTKVFPNPLYPLFSNIRLPPLKNEIFYLPPPIISEILKL